MSESPTEIIQVAELDDLTRAKGSAAPPHTAPKPRLAAIWGRSTRRRGLSASYGVWAGLALVASGFVVITFAWAKTATQVDVVKQMPYIVPWGMTGLALVIIGIAVVDMAVRRQDRLERRQQLSQMRQVIAELRHAFEDEGQ